jgi:hypothetical protein
MHTRTAAVDVCPQVSILPGPTVSKAEFNAHRERYAGRRVVCYCTAGLRSGLLASQLRSQGWDAYNLHGSILAWVGSRLRGATGAAERSKRRRLRCNNPSNVPPVLAYALTALLYEC